MTTAAVLDALGPDARLRTTVETAGRLDGLGRILGDVYLVGRGDPNLSGRFTDGRPTAIFEEMAEALRQQGVRRIEGRLVGHEGLFTGDRRGDDWSWGDLVWGYGAEVSALSFNDNVAVVTVTPGEREGDPIVVDRGPPARTTRVTSTAVTGPRGGARELDPEARLRVEPHPPLRRRAAGSAARHGPWPSRTRRATPPPCSRRSWPRRGIEVASGVDTTSQPLPAGVRVLAAHDSEPMAEIVKVVNKVSQNLHTEMLLRLLGAKVKGEGSVETGHAAVEEFLRRLGASPRAGRCRTPPASRAPTS